MLEVITADGFLSWACHNEECDFHGDILTAHITHDTVRYVSAAIGCEEQAETPQRSQMPRRRLIDVDPMLDALLPHTPIQRGSGAVIALPPCLYCNSQMFLKADYTLKEVIKHDILLPFIEDTDNSIQGYVMKLTHARNFRLLNMLYAIGKMPEKPILTTLPLEVIAHSPLAQFRLDVVDAFWLPFALTEKAPPIAGIYEPLMAMKHLIKQYNVSRIAAMEDRKD